MTISDSMNIIYNNEALTKIEKLKADMAERFKKLYTDPYANIMKSVDRHLAATPLPKQVEVVNQIVQNHNNRYETLYGENSYITKMQNIYNNSSLAKYNKVVENFNERQEFMNSLSNSYNNKYSNIANSGVFKTVELSNYFSKRMNTLYNNKYENMMSTVSKRLNSSYVNTSGNASYNSRGGDVYGGDSTSDTDYMNSILGHTDNDNSYYTNNEKMNFVEYVSNGASLQGGGDNYYNITINVEMNNKIEKETNADMVIRELERRLTESLMSGAEGIHI